MAVAILLALVGCEQRKPAVSDAEMNLVRADSPGMSEDCLSKFRWGGISALPQATDQCFKMTKAERWRGLWARGFELSKFCPAPERSCNDDDSRDYIWLTPRAPVQLPPYHGQDSMPLYEVEFIGRMTADRGHFGHMGGGDREMIVDRWISVREVPEPRGQSGAR